MCLDSGILYVSVMNTVCPVYIYLTKLELRPSLRPRHLAKTEAVIYAHTKSYKCSQRVKTNCFRKMHFGECKCMLLSGWTNIRVFICTILFSGAEFLNNCTFTYKEKGENSQ